MNSDRISSLMLLLLSVFIVAESRRYTLGTLDYPGPGFLPMLLGIAIGLMALVLLSVSPAQLASRKSPWPERQGFIRIGAIMAGILLYAFFIDVSGYLLNTFLLFVLLLRPVGRQSWSMTLLVSVAGALASYLLFDVWLNVQLPRGSWFQ